VIRTLLLSTVALAALAGTAAAADLPSRRAPPVYVPPPIPVFTWTGLYIGGQVGYEFGRSSASGATGAGPTAGGANPNGVIGGAHIGYLYSTQGIPGFGAALGSGGVIGIEGDVDGSNYRSTYALGPITDQTRQNIQGSVRGRLGVAVDRALFYATGGVAFGDLGNNYTSATGASTSISHGRVGWTGGGGVEYAFTNNWSVRAEYRYTDFGSVTDTFGAATVRHHETDNRVQAGFSYKFNTFAPLPVVARY
jgi:outer membrane immunogenic protein